MSHVRNLFHKTYRADGHIPSAQSLPVAKVQEFVERAPVMKEYPQTAPQAAPAVLEVSAPALSELAVEQANVRSEHRIVFYTDPHTPAADRFRYLRMRLRESGKWKKLLITSPLPGDGKSTVTLNLATALSERGKRAVLLVDADFHRSCLAEKLGLKSWAGLAECLHDGVDPMKSIRRVDPFGWYLLPAGEPPNNPTELLQAPSLAAVMDRVSPHFDWILIDSPPAIPLTDAISLQHHADASLLVVRAGKTPRDAVDQAKTLLGPQNILGVVLNGIESRNHVYGRYQSYERRN